MSFAKETKRDLCGKVIENECCKRALLYGILLFSNTFSHSKIKLITESEPLKNLCVSEIKRQFGITPNEYESEKGTKDNRYSSYKLTVSQRGDLARIFDLLDFGYDESLVKIKKEIISCRECERAFIRGVFLSSGTVSNPEVSYHLEMTTPYMELSKGLSKLLKKQGLEPNISVRNNDFVIYYKDGEKISSFFGYIGSEFGYEEIINSIIFRDLRNNINRVTNCETANIDKIVAASLDQVEAINKLKESGRIELLSAQLKHTANVRLEYPDLSLSELAKKFTPPLTKSGLNHRLKKIVEFAQE